MSRRYHHGSPRRARPAGRELRRGPVVTERTVVERQASTPPAEAARTTAEPAAEAAAPVERPAGEVEDVSVAIVAPATAGQGAAVGPSNGAMLPGSSGGSQPPGRPARDTGRLIAEPSPDRGATAPQLRRFIKSRAYVPMHELRRRFGINGDDDDVTALELEHQRVYIGLPPREGQLLGELLRGGDIGVELSLDPIAPMVVGVYPMRPILRS